jgi:hypothetical protein
MSLEDKIEALTTAIVANTAAILGGAAPATKKRGAAKETESAQPAATSATPAATAPAAGLQTQSPAASDPVLSAAEIEQIIKLSGKTGAPLAELQTNLKSAAGLLVAATEAIIVLAGAHSRDTAVGILAKRKVTRCSELPAAEHRPVLNEALAEIAKAEALKAQATANASLV